MRNSLGSKLVIFFFLFIAAVSLGLGGHSFANEATTDFQDQKYLGAETEETEDLDKGLSITGYFFRMVIALAVTILMAYIVMRFLQRSKVLIQADSQWIQIYDQSSLGQNKGVYLIEVAGKVLVVGAGQESVNLLAEITDENTIKAIREEESFRVVTSSKKPEAPQFKTHIKEQIAKIQSLTSSSFKGKDD